MSEVQIPWPAGKPGPSRSISGYMGGGPLVKSYGVPAEYLRAAGYVPASEVRALLDECLDSEAAWDALVALVAPLSEPTQ